MTEQRDNLDVLLAEAACLGLGLPQLPLPGTDEPEEELILRYLDADLPPREREEARRRIFLSAYCRERLEVLRDAIAEASPDLGAPPAGNGEPQRLCFLLSREGLRFLFGTIAPGSLVAVPVATRGRAPDTREETAFFDFTHRFGDVEFRILIESVPGGRLDLQLQCEAPQPQPLRVSLSDRAGTLLDSLPVERGLARFASLSPCSHRISITDSRRELGQLLLDVRTD